MQPLRPPSSTAGARRAALGRWPFTLHGRLACTCSSPSNPPIDCQASPGPQLASSTHSPLLRGQLPRQTHAASPLHAYRLQPAAEA